MTKNAIGGVPPPDGGYGWIIVLATTLINISVLPLIHCFGIIFEEDFKKWEVTGAKTALLLHLHSAIYCILGLLGSPLLKKYDFKRVAFMGTCLMSLGIFLSSFGQSYAALICTVALLIGVGQGIMLPATYLATNTYFKKRLTLAVSFSVTGASISQMVMPQICTKLLKILTAQQTVLVLAALSLVAIVCCFLLKPIKTESKNQDQAGTLEAQDQAKASKEEIELLSRDGQVYKETTLPLRQKSFLSRIYELFNLELLTDTPYVVTIIGMSLSFASELNIILMLAFILPELAGFAKEQVALALTLQSIADITGRLAVPTVGHYFDVSPRIMYACSLIVSTVGRTVMASFYESIPVIYVCVGLFGLAKGTKAVYQSVIIPRYVSLEKLPAGNGMNMVLTGVASLAIGPVIGAIHDATDSYIYAIHAGSFLSMACVALWFLFYIFYERNNKQSEAS